MKEKDGGGRRGLDDFARVAGLDSGEAMRDSLGFRVSACG